MMDSSPTKRSERAGAGDWSRPAVEQAAPGVFRIPLSLAGDSLRAVNVYALVHDGRITLVDSGWSFGSGLHELSTALGSLDLDIGHIDRVLVTHVHRDHYTLAMRLRELFGTRVSLGVDERDSLERIRCGQADGQRSWLGHWGAEELRAELDALAPPPPSRYEMPDDWIDGPNDIPIGDRILRAVPTPGHTRGHLVFVDVDNGLLFSGDHVLPQITPSIGFEPVRANLPLADFLQSLQVVRRLPDLDLLPAHGPLGRRSHERVDELAEHHIRRLKDTTGAVGRGPTSAFEVARNLTWTRHERSFVELDTSNQLLAVAETAAHLDVLVRDGLLTFHDADSTRLYEPSLSLGGTDAHHHE